MHVALPMWRAIMRQSHRRRKHVTRDDDNNNDSSCHAADWAGRLYRFDSSCGHCVVYALAVIIEVEPGDATQQSASDPESIIFCPSHFFVVPTGPSSPAVTVTRYRRMFCIAC